MKLTETQAEAAKQTLGADPIPEDHPVAVQLSQTFGEHSFYLDNNGLLVFEPTKEDPAKAGLFLIAAWTDEDKKELGGIQPQPTNIVLDLENPQAPEAPQPNGAA
ncbi:hypothetical protein FF098_010575 [Parvularcula flava]|uniref:Uncharacterized protein n=1 Tax=Aquisalinus luteolus TaxID=1566827 RepID=A0A8J3A4K9_9PROT|nr:hypothetical protein [Aquisalinus luteolus]NHK28349.1 hypothetical protein [Aquisalinus luteolus]GGH98208.1 hypothetical protein GCM10011355_21260 [Aquisalinus luteolus]